MRVSACARENGQADILLFFFSFLVVQHSKYESTNSRPNWCFDHSSRPSINNSQTSQVLKYVSTHAHLHMFCSFFSFFPIFFRSEFITLRFFQSKYIRCTYNAPISISFIILGSTSSDNLCLQLHKLDELYTVRTTRINLYTVTKAFILYFRSKPLLFDCHNSSCKVFQYEGDPNNHDCSNQVVGSVSERKAINQFEL